MNDEEKIESTEIEIVEEESNEVEVWRPGKPPISFLNCSTCYLKDVCQFKDLQTNTCALQQLETIDTTTPEGIIGMVQTLLAAQAQRVLRFIKIEEMESGFPDPSVTNELMTFMAMVEKFKKILSDDDFLVIKAKGKAGQGLLERLFGDIDKEG